MKILNYRDNKNRINLIITKDKKRYNFLFLKNGRIIIKELEGEKQ